MRVACQIVILIVVVLGPLTEAAARPESDSKPLYFKETGAYFQLFKNYGPGRGGISWGEAAKQARQLRHGDRTGRLAIVDSLNKHVFLRQHLTLPKKAWIGLRYWCSARELMWVDGTLMKRGGFEPWMPQWHLTHIRCEKNPIKYMPVLYTRAEFRWQAAGQAKHMTHFIVEFPPPKRSDGSSVRKE